MRRAFGKGQKAAARRRRATQMAKQRYPAGRALARIEFFEAQRGLPKTIYSKGCVTSADARAPRLLKHAPKKRRARSAPVYAAAYRARGTLSRSFAASVDLPTWRPLGPNLIPHGQTHGSGGNNKPSVSGRCVGIVISPNDPNHLIVCSAGGGLWESRDQGGTWLPLTDSQPTLSMGAIASAPSSPNIVYAGTGEGDSRSRLGVGLLRSSDSGTTWELVPARALAGAGIFDIQVNPTDPLQLWVSTTEGLLESANGGRSWRLRQDAPTWDVSINPQNGSELFAATVLGLVHSRNGGQSWAPVALPGAPAGTQFTRMDVCHAPSRPAVVYVAAAFGGNAALWRRARTAGRFSVQRTPSLNQWDMAQAWWDWCFVVSPSDLRIPLDLGTRSGVM